MASLKDDAVRVDNVVLQDQLTVAHPVIYADQVATMGFGPFTSRFTLAIENPAAGARTAVATVIMPTAGMYQLATMILEQLSGQENLKRLSQPFDDFIAYAKQNPKAN